MKKLHGVKISTFLISYEISLKIQQCFITSNSKAPWKRIYWPENFTLENILQTMTMAPYVLWKSPAVVSHSSLPATSQIRLLLLFSPRINAMTFHKRDHSSQGSMSPQNKSRTQEHTRTIIALSEETTWSQNLDIPYKLWDLIENPTMFYKIQFQNSMEKDLLTGKLYTAF